MSPQNRKANIAEELSQCDDALRAAEALRSLNLLRDAANRLYYAVFHAARAVLITQDIEPASHQGVLTMLGLNFIKTGLLPAQMSATFRRLQAFREAADYTVGFVVTAPDVDADLAAARDFVAQVRQYLTTAGY